MRPFSKGIKMKISRNLATTLATATFAVVGVSGVLLFLGVRGGALKEAHEWIGLAMVVATALHIFANFSAFKNYFEGKKLAAIALVLAASTAWILLTPSKANPAKKMGSQLYSKILNAPASEACALLKCDSQKLGELAKSANSVATQTPKELIANGISEEALMAVLIK